MTYPVIELTGEPQPKHVYNIEQASIFQGMTDGDMRDLSSMSLDEMRAKYDDLVIKGNPALFPIVISKLTSRKGKFNRTIKAALAHNGYLLWAEVQQGDQVAAAGCFVPCPSPTVEEYEYTNLDGITETGKKIVSSIG